MHYRMALCSGAMALLLTGCGEEPKQPPKAAPAPAPTAVKPADESRRFPLKERTGTMVVQDKLLGHDFLPGGNVATYERGAKRYKLFLIRLSDPAKAGILLLDYKTRLKDAKFVASFGGYFGDDEGKPVFVFSKNEWLMGVQGLNQQEADAVAREFAGRI